MITTKNHPATGATTRLVLTTRLRATTWLRRFDPLMLLAVALLLGAVGGGLVLERAATAVRERQAIILIATVQPTVALPTPVPTAAAAPTTAPALAVAPAEMHVDAAPAPTAAPTAGYIAHTTEGDIVIPPDATPVPADQPYTGPFLAPEPAAQPAPTGPRLCTGFGDWRDYDQMYTASPACNPTK